MTFGTNLVCYIGSHFFFYLPTVCNTCREITGCSTRMIFERDIKINLDEVEWTAFFPAQWRLVSGCCEIFIEIFGFHKRRKFFSS